MNLEQFLVYVTHHSETIIQWLFFGILLISGTLIARGLFSSKDSSADSGESAVFSEALQKIMEQTAKLESVSLDKLSAQGVQQVETQLIQLKADLLNREAEIAKLKESGGANSGDALALSSRVEELESKLAEYEILEDDIADLSLYKEENTRLRTELDKIKAGGPVVAGVAAAPPRTAEPDFNAAADILADDSVDALTAALTEAEAGAKSSLLSPEEIASQFAKVMAGGGGDDDEDSMIAGGTQARSKPLEVPLTGDPMVDFETAIKAEKAHAEGLHGPAAVSAAPAPVAQAAPEVSDAQAEADDLFAEFGQNSNEDGKPAETEEDAEDDGTLDTDKMMAEMAALVNFEPSGDNALEDSIDTDKMALEATNLGTKS